jgi:uncharacterized RmlC-like cupin family protein
MTNIERIPLEPKYRRDNGLFVVSLDNLVLPPSYDKLDFDARERSLVSIPAGQAGGNHKHPRLEAFFTLDSTVELHWIDGSGAPQMEPMGPVDGQAYVFVIPPMVPHAVLNNGEAPITLIEFADGPQRDVEPIRIV